jgi:hypothetical protein
MRKVKQKHRLRQERIGTFVIGGAIVVMFVGLFICHLIGEQAVNKYSLLIVGLGISIAWGGNLVLNALYYGYVSVVGVGTIERRSRPVAYWIAMSVFSAPALALLYFGIYRAI